MALAKGGQIERSARFPRKLEFLDEGRPVVVGQEPGDAVGVRAVDRGPLGFRIAVAHCILRQVIGARKSLALADRPGDRRCVERQLLLDLVEDFEGVARLAIHLVDEGDDRDVAQPADLEQFQRARLDALGGVDDHDGRIDGRQRAVGVVGKILVAGRVEQVEDVVAIFEGHHRGDDRDAALALDLHPVGARVHAVLLGLDLAGELDRAAEQEQLFGQRRLAGVGVRNDRKGAAARDRLLYVVGHVRNSLMRGLLAGAFARVDHNPHRALPEPPQADKVQCYASESDYGPAASPKSQIHPIRFILYFGDPHTIPDV